MDDKTPLHIALQQLKIKSGLSIQKIAIDTDIPESTLSRIYSGETERPSFHAISKIVKKTGGSLDVLAGLKEARDVFVEEHLRKELEAAVKDNEKANARIAELQKWIMRLFTMLCVLIGVIVIIVILDHLNSGWGFFRH